MSYLNDEYKKYFSSILKGVLSSMELKKEAIKISPKFMFQIDYIKLRLNNIETGEPVFDHGYEPKNEWYDIPEVSEKLLSYNNWLNERRKRGIDSLYKS